MAYSRLSDKYKLYIRSQAWRAKREEAFRFYGRRCQVCGGTKRLEINHLNYSSLYNERVVDLSVLCHSCHMEYTFLRRKLSKRKHTGPHIIHMMRVKHKRKG